ncbi:hypothetical protein [Mucilaginibacter sp. OK283]|uniref:hypothetical protein n=1 Tax=Mucilaginibacter sp. OK283 TaxID=1881049 RepID=UPI00115FDC50|nr:hypothetical protein [Mucilaginibacter sp. OK283]
MVHIPALSLVIVAALVIGHFAALSFVIGLRCHWSLGFSIKKQDGKKSPDGGLEKAVPFPMTNDQ